MKTRPFSVGSYVHVMKRGTRKMPIVHDTSDMDRFIHMLYYFNDEYCDENWHRSLLDANLLSTWQRLPYWPERKPLVKIIFFCLMPNHFHLLLKEVTEGGLSLFMQKLLTGYSMYFNTKYHRRGTLFEGRFKAKDLYTDEYLKYQYVYIHLNPIGIIDAGWKDKQIENRMKAKKFLKNYKYSSYKDYVGENREESAILNKEAFPEYFSSNIDFDETVDWWINFESEE